MAEVSSAAPAISAKRVVSARSSVAMPAAPTAAIAPTDSPPRTEPTTNQVAVVVNRLPRPASVMGVIEESMESPHGDQMPRNAAMAATGRARMRTVRFMAPQGYLPPPRCPGLRVGTSLLLTAGGSARRV